MMFRVRFLIFAALTLMVPAAASAQAPLVDGFGGPQDFGMNQLVRGDDDPSTMIDLATIFPAGLNFFGTVQNTLFININGNITFAGALESWTPEAFPVADRPMIAPFWADVDIRAPADASIDNMVYFHAERGRLVVTWHDVGFFNQNTSRLNSFQLILSERSDVVAGDFDVEFRYNRCEWMAGQEMTSGGDANGQCAPGSTCVPAQAGFDAGDEMNFEALPGSRTNDVLLLCNNSNVGETGVWRYQIRSGGVVECGNGFREEGEACDDSNTEPGDGCSASCDLEQNNGEMCESDVQCRSGECVDGVCCDTACEGQCEACAEAGSVGTCSAVRGAPVGMREACAGSDACMGMCDGRVRDQCTFPGVDVECAPARCSGGSVLAASACDGAGSCTDGAATACMGFACRDAMCLTECVTAADCLPNHMCLGGVCVPEDSDTDGDGYCPNGKDLDGNGICDGAEEAELSDCNDGDATINPDAAENCTDGIDNDCDGQIDIADSDCATSLDGDDDGFCADGQDVNNDGDCADEGEQNPAEGFDCDDSNPSVRPGNPEICGDGLDNNCDGNIDAADAACAGLVDADGDGWCVGGRDLNMDGDCADMGEQVSPADCDDAEPRAFPSNVEDCGDGIDNECDGLADAQDPDCVSFSDQDGDGWCPRGQDLNGDGDCQDDGEGPTTPADCDDTDPSLNAGAVEVCDGADNNCNGLRDEGLEGCGTTPMGATCTDGIRNGDEVGVDCGGSVCEACVAGPGGSPMADGFTGGGCDCAVEGTPEDGAGLLFLAGLVAADLMRRRKRH